MLAISQIVSAEDMDATRDLVREFTAWGLTFEPDAMSAPTFANLEGELAALPGIYGPPTGAFLLARDDGRAAGCAAFRALDPATVELKRMYVRPAHRGAGAGRALVAGLIAEARGRGVRRMVLDSHRTMTGAHRIYRAAGFRDVEAPADFPAALRTRVVFMAMDLG